MRYSNANLDENKHHNAKNKTRFCKTCLYM